MAEHRETVVMLARSLGLSPQEVRNMDLGDVEEYAKQVGEAALGRRMAESARKAFG